MPPALIVMRTVRSVMVLSLLVSACLLGSGQDVPARALSAPDAVVTVTGRDQSVLPLPLPWRQKGVSVPAMVPWQPPALRVPSILPTPGDPPETDVDPLYALRDIPS
jgi:hypothetical protein